MPSGRDPNKPLKTRLEKSRALAHVRIALVSGLTPKQIVKRKKFKELGISEAECKRQMKVLADAGVELKQPHYILTKASVICNLSVRRFRHLVDQYGIGDRISPRVTLISIDDLKERWNVDRDFGSPSHMVEA